MRPSELHERSCVRSFRRLGLILAACMTFSSCASLSEELPPNATGPEIYARFCQKCHGATGRGDGPQAQWKYLPPANFHSPATRTKSDEQLLSVIEHGVIFTPMHSYRGTLTHAQMREVLAHIRQLSQPAK